MLWLLKRKKIDYSGIISTLETGNEIEVKKLLWQPESHVIEYMPFILGKLIELKPPSGMHLEIHQHFEKGGFELVIFTLPWSNEKIPYSPVIFDKKTGKIVGNLMPFNELHGLLSKRQRSQINALGMIWIKFTFPYNFK